MGGGVQHNRAIQHSLRRRVRTLRCLFVLCLPVLMASPAEAGAWTRPAGKGLIISSASHHQFDLQAEGFGYSKFESSVYLEYGLTDRFTLQGRLAQETRFHQSRVTLDKGGSVVHLSVNSVSHALGESEIGIRTRLAMASGWTVSAQTSLVRFSLTPNPLLEREAQWGSDGRLMIGRALGERAFADLQFGHRGLWSGGQGETRLDLTLGLRPVEAWLFLAQSYSAWGRTEWSAYTRSYESHRVHLSVIAPLNEGLSFQVGAIRSAHSDSLAPETAYMVSLWREF